MINELIEQIGGRDGVEDMAEGNWPDSGFYDNVKLMARALLAVLDAKPVGEFYEYDPGDWYQRSPGDKGVKKWTPLYKVQPAASAPDRNQLRELVDMVWNEATESETVPSTADADRIIDKVFHGIAQEAASSRYQSVAPALGDKK